MLDLGNGRTYEKFHLDFDRIGPINICESAEGGNLCFAVPANLSDCPPEWDERRKRRYFG